MMLSETRRGRLEICIDVLQAVLETQPSKRTWLMAKANTNWPTLLELLEKMTHSGLIVVDPIGISITDLGRDLLSVIRQLQSYADFAVATVLPS